MMVAALPLRQSKGGALEILLITSRDTGRWIIPKDWSSIPSKRCWDAPLLMPINSTTPPRA